MFRKMMNLVDVTEGLPKFIKKLLDDKLSDPALSDKCAKRIAKPIDAAIKVACKPVSLIKPEKVCENAFKLIWGLADAEMNFWLCKSKENSMKMN